MKARAAAALLVGLLGSGGAAALAGCGGLPKTFGECGKSVCEVDLAAFTDGPGGPLCAKRREDALVCGGGEVTDGSCGGLYVIRTMTYDVVDCIYDEATGDLVGARWGPDAHPVQIAGETLPPDCVVDGLPCA